MVSNWSKVAPRFSRTGILYPVERDHFSVKRELFLHLCCFFRAQQANLKSESIHVHEEQNNGRFGDKGCGNVQTIFLVIRKDFK